MPTQIQWRRGTTAQTAAFTGALAEVTVDTEKNTLVVHDGVTPGGFAVALERDQRDAASFGQANSAFDRANSAFAQANLAYSAANTKFSSSGGTINGNVVIDGNVSPHIDNVYSLGSSDKRFKDIYVGSGTVYIGDVSLSTTGGKLQITGATDLILTGASTPSSVQLSNVANSAFAQANLAYDAANSGIGIATSGFAQANAAYNKANSAYDLANNVAPQVQPAFDKANAGFGLATSGFAQANLAYAKANSAYDLASNVAPQVQPAFDTANSAYSKANAGFGLATSGFAQANLAYDKANAATILAQGAYDSANNVAPQIQPTADKANNAFAQANLAYTQANTGTVLAQDAYDRANTKISSSGGTFTGPVIINSDLTVSGNVSYTGNVTSVQITGNTGQFFGDAANGFQALYAGIPTGYTFQEQTVIQSTGNYDGFIQINLQNINTGQNASSDLIATNDNIAGDAYIDVGINSTTYNNSAYALQHAGDGYVYVNANTQSGGGNLVFSTTASGRDIIFSTGGTTHANEIARFKDGVGLVMQGKPIKFADATTQNTAAVSTAYSAGIYAAANSALGVGNSGFAQANLAYGRANSSFGQANLAFTQANSASGVATSAFGQANLAFTQANSASGVATSAFGQANLAYAIANSAAYSANTKVSKNGDTIAGTLTAEAFVSNTTFSVGGTSYVAVSSNTFTTSSTTQVAIDSFDKTVYRSAKYFVQLTSGTSYHTIEINVMHDGTTTYIAQYGEMFSGSSLGTFDAYISGGFVNLYLTAANNVTVAKLARTAIVI
jgi:hypothetical protein